MSRVFLVQRPVFKDHGTGRWVDKYDLSPAEEHGPIVEVMPAGNIPRDVGSMMRMVQERLADFTQDDHLCAVGDPVAIAIATLVASQRTGGPVSLLKWDKRAGRYTATLVDPTTGPRR